MSPPQELDYIGLSDASSAVVDGGGGGGGSAAARASLNLKETELRLGPPGSESPDRSDGRTPLTLTLDLLQPKSGAKRGFSLASGSDAAAGGAPAGAAATTPKAAPAPPKSQIPSGRADPGIAPAAKAQVVGWPPIRSYRKNTMAPDPVKKEEAEVKQGTEVVGWPPIRSYRKNTMATNPVKIEEAEVKQGAGCLYVKVSMDGAPYLRKVDLKTYCNYKELSMALEKMFSGFTIGQCGGQGVPGRDGVNEIRLMDLLSGSEYVLTYEDKDGDWMLVGDVPWEMFSGSCRRLRIMKGSDAIGLAPRVMEKCKNRK